jgi:hypothetical protein
MGNFWNRFQDSDFFVVFPQCTDFKFLDFYAVSSDFLGDPKYSQSADFSAVSWNFEGQACPKILRSFPAMNRAQNLDLPAVSRNF